MNIYTQRLEIRPFSRDSWRDLKRIALDFQASEYRYYDHEMPTQDDRIRSVADFFESTGLCFGVFWAGGSEMLGYVGFHYDRGDLEIGYCFHSSIHGRGVAFESIHALMQFFEETGLVERFTAGTALDNAPSVRLLNRLGFVLTGVEEVCFYDGHPFPGGRFEKRVDAPKAKC